MTVYVKVPSPVQIFERIVNPSTGMSERKSARTMTFFDIIDWLTNDNYFSSPAKMGKVAAELMNEFEKAQVGDFVKLTSEQHDHIKKVLEKPSNPYIAIINKQITSLLDALAEPLSEEQYKRETAREIISPVNGQGESAERT